MIQLLASPDSNVIQKTRNSSFVGPQASNRIKHMLVFHRAGVQMHVPNPKPPLVPIMPKSYVTGPEN